jgi:hypothetical protein
VDSWGVRPNGASPPPACGGHPLSEREGERQLRLAKAQRTATATAPLAKTPRRKELPRTATAVGFVSKFAGRGRGGLRPDSPSGLLRRRRGQKPDGGSGAASHAKALILAHFSAFCSRHMRPDRGEERTLADLRNGNSISPRRKEGKGAKNGNSWVDWNCNGNGASRKGAQDRKERQRWGNHRCTRMDTDGGPSPGPSARGGENCHGSGCARPGPGGGVSARDAVAVLCALCPFASLREGVLSPPRRPPRRTSPP